MAPPVFSRARNSNTWPSKTRTVITRRGLIVDRDETSMLAKTRGEKTRSKCCRKTVQIRRADAQGNQGEHVG